MNSDNLDIISIDFDVIWNMYEWGCGYSIYFHTSYGIEELQDNKKTKSNTKHSIITVRNDSNKCGLTHIIVRHYVNFSNKRELVRYFLSNKIENHKIERNPPMLVTYPEENKNFLIKVSNSISLLLNILPKVLSGLVIEYIY